MRQSVIVVDFGGQYNQLIARRVRECSVYCEVVPYKKALDAVRAQRPCGVIFTGGPASVYGEDAPTIGGEIFSLGIPVLGICYGAQLMAHLLGGRVEHIENREFGRVEIGVVPGSLIARATNGGVCWMSHTDQIVAPPAGFVVTASSESCACAAMEDPERRLYAVQFHPEVEHTPFGREYIRRFLYDVCAATGDWTAENFVREQTEALRAQLGDSRVLCALSGGVDSTVCAVLLHKAIGDRLTCIFVDHGLLRKNEGDEVMGMLKREFDLDVRRADASERFLGALAGVSDPETKRKIIGREFIEVFDEQVKLLGGGFDYLLQGTIYPDVIESGTGDAAVIKSHHNVGGLPARMKLKLCEPLRLLFKDEVRNVGRALGIPEAVVERQPFPGPGLAVRCLGELTPEKLFILRESDAILREEIKKAGLQREIWQYFTVLPNLQSVGVMGDARTYFQAVGIRAVTSSDAMTADFAHIPYDVLSEISRRIVNEVPGVNRVLYDITTKPPATIEWE